MKNVQEISNIIMENNMKKIFCPICGKVMEVNILYSKRDGKEIKLDIWMCRNCNLILTKDDLSLIL